MRATGVAPNFQTPSRESPSAAMWITIALCVFLPPIGLIRLWASARNPLRGKLVISIIAVLSMTLMLVIYMSSRQHNSRLIEQEYQLPQAVVLTTPTPAPAVTPAPQPADDGLILANPMG